MLLVCVLSNFSYSVRHSCSSCLSKCCWFVCSATYSSYSVRHSCSSSLSECCWFVCSATLATASDILVAHPFQNAAGLCADQQQFHCSTLFCFHLIPIKMLLVCVDINNLQCRTLFYLILVRMLLVYVLVNNSLFSYSFFFFYLIPISVLPGCAVCITVLDLILLVPHQYAAGLCAIVAVSVFYIFCFMGKILLDIFVLLFFYLFSIKMLLCCCCCCFNYLLLSFLLEAYLNK